MIWISNSRKIENTLSSLVYFSFLRFKKRLRLFSHRKWLKRLIKFSKQLRINMGTNWCTLQDAHSLRTYSTSLQLTIALKSSSLFWVSKCLCSIMMNRRLSIFFLRTTLHLRELKDCCNLTSCQKLVLIDWKMRWLTLLPERSSRTKKIQNLKIN